jgi:hypothetical protein
MKHGKKHFKKPSPALIFVKVESISTVSKYHGKF